MICDYFVSLSIPELASPLPGLLYIEKLTKTLRGAKVKSKAFSSVKLDKTLQLRVKKLISSIIIAHLTDIS